MKRLITSVAMLAFAMASTAHAGGNEYGWSISASSTDPDLNTGAIPQSVPTNTYLWLECTANDGMSAAEMDIEATGLLFLSFVPMNGVLNAGAGPALLLAVGGCPSGPFMAGAISVLDASGLGGSICPVPSAANGSNVTVNCDPINPMALSSSSIGFATTGGSPCVNESMPCIVPVEDQAWGAVKSLYR